MIFVFPFHPGDKACAEQTLAWAVELGGCKGHSIILMPAKKVMEFDRIRQLAGTAFDAVSVLLDAEGIEGHPQGPNSMMRQAIWHMQTDNLGPWMFWEPDCIPRDAGFADRWQNEYLGFGKPFMGERRPAHDQTPDYLTGNMVLPKDALLLAPMLSRRGLSRDGVELAFDIVSASQTLPQAHLTKLLQQVPKNTDGSAHHFPDQASLSILRPEAVFFHPCKDGSLIERLREKRSCSEFVWHPDVVSMPVKNEDISELGLIQDLENLRRENEILRAELLKLKSVECVSGLNVSPSRDEQERDVVGIPTTLPPEGSTPSSTKTDARRAAIEARIAKAMATKKKKAERSRKMKESWAKRKAQVEA